MCDETDARSECKYGEKCYQKNSEHLKKYRHSLKRTVERDEQPSPAKKSSKDVVEPIVSIKSNKLPENPHERIKVLFLVEMPSDFYSFYEFCKSITTGCPKKALKLINLELVGPFDALDGVLKDCSKDEALCHYRYFFDPPEFQTVLKVEEENQLHYGYFRDSPKEMPCFVAKNKAIEGPTIICVAGNLFGAVNVHIEDVKSKADIFRKTKMQKLQSALKNWAKKNDFTLDTVTAEIRTRRENVVAKTLNGIGVVVPYDKKTDVGYRPLAVDGNELKKLLKNIVSAATEEERNVAWSQLQPVITAASIANDECDFGTSLELGIDMFSYGEKIFHTVIQQILCITYQLLKRNEFADILKAHLKHRKKDSSLSIII